MSMSRISFVPLVYGLKHHIRSQETSPVATWHWEYYSYSLSPFPFPRVWTHESPCLISHRTGPNWPINHWHPLSLPTSLFWACGPVSLLSPFADSYRSRDNSMTYWAATYLSLFILCVVYKAFLVTFSFSSKTSLQNQKVKDNSLWQFHLCIFKDVWLRGSTNWPIDQTQVLFCVYKWTWIPHIPSMDLHSSVW